MRVEESFWAVVVRAVPRRRAAGRESMLGGGLGWLHSRLGFFQLNVGGLSWSLYPADLLVLYASGTAIYFFNPGLERMSCRVDGMVVQV